MEKSPNRIVRGRACLTLGQLWKSRAGVVRRIRKEPDVARNVEQSFGKQTVTWLREADGERLERDAEKQFEQVIAEYGDVKQERRGTLGEQAREDLFEMRHLSIGKTAPDIEGEDIDGKRFKLSDYRGKIVALVFWGHWCGPCRAMYPHERSLVQRLADKPFVLLGVNSDRDRDALRKTIIKEKITWRAFWDGGRDGPIAQKWNISGWPTIYVLDGKGVIRYRDVRGEKLDKVVDNLLAEMQAKK
jgi:thiol-disulfide isomerase/thioredoxin